MLNSIIETRIIRNGLYNITLEINEKDYFSVYKNLEEGQAYELLEKYLRYRGDDGRPEDIKIKHRKNVHTVIISSDLHYAENPKYVNPYQVHGHIGKKGGM
jgi:hypothetical protein